MIYFILCLVLLDEALELVARTDDLVKLLAVLEAKYRALKGDPQEKFKLIRFGLTRGYEYEKIAPVVDEILKKNG